MCFISFHTWGIECDNRVMTQEQMNRICLSHSFNPRCWALSNTVSWATTTPTGRKWYWSGALLRQRDCSVLHYGSGLTAQKVIRRRKKITALFSFIKTVCSSQKSPEFQFYFVFCSDFFFFVEYHSSLFLTWHDLTTSPDSKFLSFSHPPFLLSLEALGTLGRPLPLCALAELCLWFIRVPSGFTGWRKDTEQSWERKAGSMKVQTHLAINYWKKKSERYETMF